MMDNKVCSTKEIFIEEVEKYNGVMLFIGHGSKNQYKKEQLNQLKKKLDSIVEEYNSKFNHDWIAIYGGDKDQGEGNPDIGYLMGYLNHHHQIPLGMILNGHPIQPSIQENKENDDKKKKKNVLLYIEFEKDENEQIIYGGIYKDHLVGASKIYLGEELIQPKSTSPSLNGIISFGGGNIAFQEISYAFKNKIPITYVPAEIGRIQLKSNLSLQKYGPIYDWAMDHQHFITISLLE